MMRDVAYSLTGESTEVWKRRMDCDFQLHCMVGRLEGLLEAMKMRVEDQQRQIERQAGRIDDLMMKLAERRR
jgi:hypothetical protein